MAKSKSIEMVILGCGGRGRGFANMVSKQAELGTVVAVAEPIAERRNRVGDQFNIPAERRFNTYQELLAKPRMGDIAINTLMDRMHVDSALKAMKLGYHMMLEKPMATSYEDCVAIDKMRRKTKRIVTVCHSMRYHVVYARIKQILDSGVLGKVVSLDQLEGVDPQHQSHSFVRGNWGNEGRSSFMLLAKSCHDIDIISYLMGEDAVRVSSFGDLSHFNKKNRPKGAPARCVDGCPVGDECPYNAVKMYQDGRPEGYGAWIGLHLETQEFRDRFLREAPWGKCAYNSDNDVVDHQVVAMEFPSGATGTFTMTAFAPGGRRLRIHATKGYIESEISSHKLDVMYFWGKEFRRERIDVPQDEGSHEGGDERVIGCLVEAVKKNDPSRILTGTEESLRSHAVVFAAEKSRRMGKTIEVAKL